MKITAGITVKHSRSGAGNHRAGQRDQPSGLSDDAAHSAETRICRPAGDGQGAAVERKPVGMVPRKDRVEVPGLAPGLRLVPVLVLVVRAAVVALTRPESVPPRQAQVPLCNDVRLRPPSIPRLLQKNQL